MKKLLSIFAFTLIFGLMEAQSVRELVESMSKETYSNFRQISNYTYWYFDPIFKEDRDSIYNTPLPDYPRELRDRCVSGEVIMAYKRKADDTDTLWLVHGIHPKLNQSALEYLGRITPYISMLDRENLETKYFAYGFWPEHKNCINQKTMIESAKQLRRQQKYTEAQQQLEELLKINFQNNDAWIELMRVENAIDSISAPCHYQRFINYGFPVDSNDRKFISEICPYESEVFTVVDKMPMFPGGDKELYYYLARNIKYPREAKEKMIQGKVFVSFVINEDGSITNLDLLRDIGGGCGIMAMEIISRMPKWEPGYQHGKPVKVRFTVPINYSLGHKPDKKKKRKRKDRS